MATVKEKQKLEKKDRYRDFRIVGIGASAGGLRALQLFFTHLPKDFPHSFVVIQHLSPDHKSLMESLLGKFTQLSVRQLREDTWIRKGEIYLIPPNRNILLHKGKLLLKERAAQHQLNLPINLFFESLSQECTSKAIGIILSGTGSDGAEGVQAIRNAGGMVMVQKPEDSQFNGMPLAAIYTGAANFVLSVQNMPKILQQYINDPDAVPVLKVESHKDKEAFTQVLDYIKNLSGINFHEYKEATLLRRLEKNMVAKGIVELPNYVQYIFNHPEEARHLAEDFLIGVTDFFRDAKLWDYVIAETFPKLIKESENGSTLKIWSIACSTGEEPYSIALALHEELRRQDKDIHIKIFASDLSKHRVEQASRGIYNRKQVQAIPEPFSRQFNRIGDDYQISDTIRKMILFNQHNILGSPPLGNMDMVFCRNLLIYVNLSAHEKINNLLRYALKSNGYLILGLNESLPQDHSFHEIQAKLKIYQNKQKLDYLNKPSNIPKNTLNLKTSMTTSKMDIRQEQYTASNFLSEILANELSIAVLYLDHFGYIKRAIGNFKKFLEMPDRGFSTNLLELVPLSLKYTLEKAFREAGRTDLRVKIPTIQMPKMQKGSYVDILICPSKSVGLMIDIRYLVVIVPAHKDVSKGVLVEHIPGLDKDLLVQDLQEQLAVAKQNMMSLKEEVEIGNEELQASNEELLATNEELQSTNEELHAVNQELHAVNEELNLKISDLAAAHVDIDNILKSTDIKTLFLSKKLNIRKYTEGIQNHFGISEKDIGRYIGNFSHNFGHWGQDLIANIEEVIESGRAFQKEICDTQGDWFLKRITPFTNTSKNIDGVVITLVDINELKTLYESNKELERFAYVASHDLQEPLRTISDFMVLFRSEYAPILDHNALTYLGFVEKASERMGSLVRDILAYSRIGHDEKLEELDLAQVISAVLQDLDTKIKTRQAQIEIKKMPTITGRLTDFHSLFLNLIGNALKFVKPEVVPHIRISARKQSGVYVISIADNGIGIPEKHQKDIFEVFKRLHNIDDYQGTGIGLAHCKKIVEMHGGKIWVESQLGSGSTFKFTLPY